MFSYALCVLEYINYVFVFCHVLEYIIMCSCSVIFRPDGIPDAILYVLFHVPRPLLLTVLPFEAAVALLRMVTLSLYRMIHVCSSCVSKSIVATVPADLSSSVSW